jgi:hypothetical protein
MNLFILSQYKLIQELYKNESFLDTLINIDDFFDILGLYVFPNWLDSEIVDVKYLRYFTNIKLKSPYKKMPHPKGAILLTKYDCQVKYKKTTEYLPREINDVNDTYVDKKTGKRKPKVDKEQVWMIDILIPNKYLYNDEVYDLENVQDKLKDEQETNQDMENMITNDGDEGNVEI